MRVTVTHTLDALERDARAIPARTTVGLAKIVRANAKAGNALAKGNARRTAGKHGKHYPNAFTAEAISPLMWEYGPDDSKPQGGMSFEMGSRNQPPHLDLTKSRDVQGPKFGKDVSDFLDRLFW